MAKNSWATRHARAVIDIDAEVRRRSPDGTRIQVQYEEIAGVLQIHKANASGALAILARIPGAGYTRVRNGEYEYRMPEHYPQELAELKKYVQTPLADKQKRHPRRGSLTSEIIDWLYKQPKGLVTLQIVARELEAHTNSTSGILRKLGDTEEFPLTPKPDIASGTYSWNPFEVIAVQTNDGVEVFTDPSTELHPPIPDAVWKREAERPELPLPKATGPFVKKPGVGRKSGQLGQGQLEASATFIDHLGEAIAAMTPKAPEQNSELPKPATPATVMPKTQPDRGRMFRQLHSTKDGRIVLEGPDHELFIGIPFDKYLKELD